jgi:HK97 family phage portal protein
MKLKNGRGRVLEIWPLRPDRIRIVPSQEHYVSHYIYDLDGQTHRIAREDLIHFKFPNPTNDYYGQSPLRACLRQIATDNDATDYSKAMLQNGGVPAGILSIPEPLSAEARKRIREQWKQTYGGNSRGEIAVLEGSTEFQQLSMDMQSLAFIDLRGISETRILMTLGVPPILVGAKSGLEHATYSNYNEARLSFWDETISALHRRFLSKIEGDKDLNPMGGSFVFDLSNVPAFINRRQTRFENAIAGFQSGLLTIDEARAEVGLEAADDALEAESDEDVSTVVDIDLKKKSRDLDLLKQTLGTVRSADVYYDRFEHWTKKELKQQGKALNKILETETKELSSEQIAAIQSQFERLEREWTAAAAASIAPIMSGLLEMAGEQAALTIGTKFDITNAATLAFIREEQYKFAASFSKTSVQAVSKALERSFDEGWDRSRLVTELKDAFVGTVATNRARLIAQTETIRAANAGSKAVYKAEGVQGIEWVASSDACPYCQGLDGKVISVEDNFVSKNDNYQPEGTTRPLNVDYGEISYPPCHPGCRCTIAPRTVL